MKKIGLLTGGGDAPGLNGILEAAGRALLEAGYSLVGIEDGFEGIFENRVRNLTTKDLEGIHCRAGSLLGTSNKSGISGRESEFLAKYKALGVSGLIVAGGDGTFSALRPFAKTIRIIGAPKTIDNDLSGTEVTFGYDTACSVVAEAVDALRATADAHRRVIIVETMGRTAGWIALGGGLASYADVILIPERPYDASALIEFIRKKHQTQRGLLVVTSEGAKARGGEQTVAFRVEGSPEPVRLGGISQKLAQWIEKETGWEARNVVLGHLQRSEYPTTTDRFLTLAMGVEIAQMVMQDQWDQAAVYREGRIVRAPLTDLMGPTRTVDPHHRWLKLAQTLGIFI